MKERHYELIKLLLFNSSPQSVEELREQIGVSERTLKYDIAFLRKEFQKCDATIQNKKGIGYYLSPMDKPAVLKYYAISSDEAEPLANDFVNIMLYFLLCENPTQVQKIAAKIYFSESRIKIFLKEVEAKLPGHIKLQFLKGSDVRLEGSERDLRNYFLEILTEQMQQKDYRNVSHFLLESYPLYKEKINENWLQRIEKTLKTLVEKWDVWISEDAFNSMVIYLYIVHIRTGNKIRVTDKESLLYKSFTNEYSFSQKLLQSLYWGIAEEEEILNLVAVMSENDVFIDDRSDSSLDNKLSRVLELMSDHLIDNFPDYQFDLKEFKKDVTPHLRQIIRRHRMDMEEKPNPLFHQIKQNYREYFRVAIALYRIFCKELEVPFSEDEVSYLTIYLYKNALQNQEKKYSIFLVCGTGRGFSKLLSKRLLNIFDNLKIIDCLSSFQLVKDYAHSKADFVISTVTIPDIGIPVVKISSFLGQEDIYKIQQFMEYGVQASSVPLLKKSDSHTSYGLSMESSLSEKNASAFSQLFLNLFNLMVDLPLEYKISQEKILGITIHTIIALPRYYKSDFMDDEDLVEEVLQIEKEHPVLARKMSEFLDTVETIIKKGVPYGERYALYQYILN